MTDQHQTEAQRLAALLRSRNNNQAGFGLGPVCDEAALELLRLNAVHTDLECVKMQLAACGVVAMADTPDSAKKARTMHPDYESASCDDVKRRVDECIELRARVAELEDVLTNLPLSSPQRLRARIQRLEEMLAAVGAGGVGPLIPTAVQHQREPSSDNELQRKTGDLITAAAPPQTGGIPPDWKLVPVKPTRGMLDAARKDLVRDAEIDPMLKGIHSAMLAAAPKPPTTEQSSVVEQPDPAYLLRDLAADIGVEALDLITAIRDADLGNYSINMMLPARVCVAMCQRFAAAPQLQVAAQPTGGAREAFEAWCHLAGLMQQSQGIVSISSHTDTAWLAWQAAIANRQQPQDEQEPVAIPDECPHIIWFDDSDMRPMMFAGRGARDAALKAFERVSVQWNAHLFVRIQKNSRDDQYPCAPLYTNPQPNREPLTDEQIATATGAKPGTPMWLVAVAFTRAIERAHGIGGEA